MLTLKLDDAINLFGLPAPNHIKIDVDGIEMKVLAGAAKTLANSGLRSVMVEAGGLKMEHELRELTTGYGLRLVRRQAKAIENLKEPKTRNNYFAR